MTPWRRCSQESRSTPNRPGPPDETTIPLGLGKLLDAELLTLADVFTTVDRNWRGIGATPTGRPIAFALTGAKDNETTNPLEPIV